MAGYKQDLQTRWFQDDSLAQYIQSAIKVILVRVDRRSAAGSAPA